MRSKLRKRLRSAVALTLSVVMVTSLLSGCAKESKTNDESGVTTETNSEKTDQIEASCVTWDRSGSYTTTLTAEGTDLSGVKAEDVFIGSKSVDFESYQKAIGDLPSEGEAPDVEEYTERIPCEITKVEEKDGSLEISFTDKDAPKKETGSYTLEIEEKEISTPVLVDYPMPEMAVEENGVLAADEEPELTLTLEDGLFAETVTADQVTLAGAFDGMEVETAKAESNRLHLKLKGKAEAVEGQGYSVDGIISLSASAMENEYSPASVRVPVRESLVTFDSSAMTVSGDQVTVPITVVGGKDVGALTPADITFPEDEMTAAAKDDAASEENSDTENGGEAARQPEVLPAVTVTKVEKQDDTHALVTMTAEGIADKNTAAAALNGRTVQVGDMRTVSNLAPASFYPFFDYVEEDGDDLKLQLQLIAQAGTFAEKLDISQVTFDGGLSDAKGVSLERQDDATALLTLTVPANGQTKEKFDYDGTVILAAGTMINPWGDPADEPAEYARCYSQETMGRMGGIIRPETFPALARGLNLAGSGLMWAGIGFAVVTVALEMSGAVKTAAQQVMEINQQINRNLDVIFEQLAINNQTINEIEEQLLWQRVNDFNVQLAMLNTYVQKLQWFYRPEKLKLLGYDPIEIGEDDSDSVKVEKLKKMKEISQAVFAAEYSPDRNIAMEFRNYYDTYNTLQKYYSNVCAMLKSTGDTNPLNTYIRLTSRNANFDTQTFEMREGYIDSIESVLLLGMSTMFVYNLRSTVVNNDNTVNLKTVMKVADDNFSTVVGELDKLIEAMEARVVEKTDDAVYYDDAYCYTFGMMVKDLDTENGDVFWAKTWREKDTVFVGEKKKTVSLKGPGVFVYSCRDDYREIIEKTKVAPSYVANNYTWGETFFSAKAPDGMPEDAIYEEVSEDLITACSSRFIQLMGGRTLKEELESAGIHLDDSVYENTPGLPFASRVVYSTESIVGMLHDEGRTGYAWNADTYMDILKWNDKKLTQNVHAARRQSVVSEINNPEAGNFLGDNETNENIGQWILDRDEKWRTSGEKYFDNVGNHNLIPIVRWVIEKPGEGGTNPDRTRYMTYATEAPAAQ